MNYQLMTDKETKMYGWIDTRIHITISPKELREVAQEMEEVWATLKPGGSTTVKVIRLGALEDNRHIYFNIDQDYFTNT